MDNESKAATQPPWIHIHNTIAYNSFIKQPIPQLIMAKISGAVTIEQDRCKGCNLCVVACPCNVLDLQPKEVNDRGYHYAYPANESACIGCAACALVCPDACIEVYKVVEK